MKAMKRGGCVLRRLGKEKAKQTNFTQVCTFVALRRRLKGQGSRSCNPIVPIPEEYKPFMPFNVKYPKGGVHKKPKALQKKEDEWTLPVEVHEDVEPVEFV